MEEKNTLVLFFEEIGGALEPLAEAIESFDNFELYMHEMGWSVSNIPPVIQSVASPLNNILDELTSGDLSADSIPEFVGLLRSVVEAINEIKNASASDLPPIAGFANEFPQQLLDRTIVDFFLSDYPIVGALLRFFGIIELNAIPASSDRLAYTELKVNWTAIANLFQDPLSTLDAAYGWKTDFDSDQFLANLRNLMSCWGVATRSGALPDSVAASLFGSSQEGGINSLILQLAGDRYTHYGHQLGLYVTPTPGSSGLVIIPYAGGEIGAKIDIDEELAITINGEATFNNGFAILFRPTQAIQFLAPGSGPAAEIDTAVKIGLEVSSSDDEPRLLFGTSEGSRLEFQSASVRVGGEFSSSHSPVAVVETALQGGKLIIDLAGSDGFLSGIIPLEALVFETDLSVGFNSATGFYFAGSGGLEVMIPAHIDLGVIKIDSALFVLKFKDGSFVFDIGAIIKADISALKVTVENMGVSVNACFVKDGYGNVGPLDLSASFKPPNSVGLAIDAAVVKGGGYLYFDFDKEEYAGILELDLQGIVSVKAIGLITTRMPDGSKGFSLLLILTAEFGSPIQLSYGFTLSGVGGLLGLNRTMRLEMIASGIRDGGINSIMFPQNVIANAPRIISDLKNYFPVEENTFLIGPMVKIGWGTPNLVTLSMGIIIEIPGNIAIVGILKVALPDEDLAVIVIQVNFIGAIEFDKKRLWFFASLYESRILFITLEGEMGLLVGWGDDPNFLISVGGFHPAFNPPPLPFGAIVRIAVSILNTDFARIRIDGYFAVTSNSVQFGAAVELFFGVSAFKIDGHLAFDALFRFSPFYFIITISASLSVKVFGIGLFSVRMRGSLEGPTPYLVEGTGSISLLFFNIDVDFSHTWGNEKETTLPPISVMPLLVDEYQKNENWMAMLPVSNQLLVTLRSFEQSTTDLILHPVGSLKISQRAVPLGMTIDKVGNQKLSDANHFEVTVNTSGIEEQGDIEESFAVGQFFTKSDNELLNAKSFEPMKGGIELSVAGEQYHAPKAVKRVARYEVIIIDTNYKRFVRKFYAWFGSLFALFLNGNAVSQSVLSHKQQKKLKPFADKVEVGNTLYTVAFNSDNSAFNDDAMAFTSQAKAEDFMKQQIATEANLMKQLHVIPQVEMRRAA